jgi:hypothetical protein
MLKIFLKILIIFPLLGATALLPATALAVSADEPIAGISPVTPAQMEAALSARNPGHIHPNIAQLYVEWGYRFGIRADVAFAQMMHETNSLKYGGDVQPSQNNFAGIGATGGGNPGNSFASAELGVIAHYAHLAWYIFPYHVNGYCNSGYDPRHFGSSHKNTVRTIRDLGGQWAVPGTGYGDAIARYANAIWSYNARGYLLGSFNEVPGHSASQLSGTWYFTWYDSLPQHGMAGNWIVISNHGQGTARVQIRIGDYVIHDPGSPANDFWSIPEGGRITPQIINLMAGPVRIESLDGQPIFASQRVLYQDTFTEVVGVPAERLSDSWEFTWYDSRPQNGMAGNWIMVANMGSVPAELQVYIGVELVATYTVAEGNALQPGAIVTPQFPGRMGGSVWVRSVNGQPLIASQRVLYKDSFSEIMGAPTAGLGSEYFFPWYDLSSSSMNGDWIVVANRDTEPADVEIYVGNILAARLAAATGNAIPPGGIAIPSFSGMMGGPVRVVSTNSRKLLVSQRTLYRDSFEEVQGVQPADFGQEELFSWYDSALVDYMRGDWLLIANRGSGEARVEIDIGSTRMHDPNNPANDFFIIPEGGVITPSFSNFMGGPVKITCTSGQPLLTSQRVLYKDGLYR